MIKFRDICIAFCVGFGFGYISVEASASDPSIYSKALTPSPLGRDRILTVCLTEKHDDNDLLKFYQSLNWDEFSSRHLTVLELSRNTIQSVIVNNDVNEKKGFMRVRHHDFGDEIREKADCGSNFEFTLIGKDMGVKKRWEGTLPQDELFASIDAMPMRRFEMRQQKENN